MAAQIIPVGVGGNRKKWPRSADGGGHRAMRSTLRLARANNVAMARSYSSSTAMIAGYEALSMICWTNRRPKNRSRRECRQIVEKRSDVTLRNAGEMQGLMEIRCKGSPDIELVLNLKILAHGCGSHRSCKPERMHSSALNIGRNVLKDKVESSKSWAIYPKFLVPRHNEPVFLNLFTNAAQAMEGQGKLAHQDMVCRRCGSHSVADNGKVSGRNIDAHLDPFFTPSQWRRYRPWLASRIRLSRSTAEKLMSISRVERCLLHIKLPIAPAIVPHQRACLRLWHNTRRKS